jgi:AcrR family transcriptional regulator
VAVRSRVAVKQQILDAAVRLFAEKGFDGTSVQEIVERAEVTKGAMYHYFSAKDDLLYEIYHELISRQLADQERILAAGLSPADTVRALIVDLVETTTARLAQAAVFAREMHKLAAGPMKALRTQRRRYHEAFRSVVERGQRDGTFTSAASAETVTLLVFGVINQLPQWYRPRGKQTPRQLADEIADFVLAGLTAQAGPAARAARAASAAQGAYQSPPSPSRR